MSLLSHWNCSVSQSAVIFELLLIWTRGNPHCEFNRSVKLSTWDITSRVPNQPARVRFYHYYLAACLISAVDTPHFRHRFGQIPASEKKQENQKQINQPFAGKQKLNPRLSGLSCASSFLTHASPIWSNSQPLDEMQQLQIFTYFQGSAETAFGGWFGGCIFLHSSNSRRIPNTEHMDHRKQDSRETMAINNETICAPKWADVSSQRAVLSHLWSSQLKNTAKQ